MKIFNTRTNFAVIATSLICCTGFSSCGIIKGFRKPTNEWNNKSKKTEVSEEAKAKAKEKLANAETVSTPKKKSSFDRIAADSIRQPAQINDNSSNLKTLPMLPKQTGLIDPEVDNIPTKKELEEVEAPTPRTQLPSITIPGQQ